MPRQDTVDFLTAFAVGTVLGIGATLLLQPDRTPKQRVVRQLKPYRKQMQRSYDHLRKGVREGRSATSDLTGEVVAAGRELLGEFRSEVADILSDARGELQEMMQDQIKGLAGGGGGLKKDLARGVKRTRRKIGL
jgi:gas vesicle protein